MLLLLDYTPIISDAHTEARRVRNTFFLDHQQVRLAVGRCTGPRRALSAHWERRDDDVAQRGSVYKHSDIQRQVIQPVEKTERAALHRICISSSASDEFPFVEPRSNDTVLPSRTRPDVQQLS